MSSRAVWNGPARLRVSRFEVQTQNIVRDAGLQPLADRHHLKSKSREIEICELTRQKQCGALSELSRLADCPLVAGFIDVPHAQDGPGDSQVLLFLRIFNRILVGLNSWFPPFAEFRSPSRMTRKTEFRSGEGLLIDPGYSPDAGTVGDNSHEYHDNEFTLKYKLLSINIVSKLNIE